MEGILNQPVPSKDKRSAGGRRRARRQGGLRRMPDLLGKVLDSEARRRGLAEARLLTDWASVIGKSIAARCQPIGLSRQGVLHLDVTGGAALELQHAELQVIERINTFFGRPTVTRLRLRQAPPERRVLTPPTVPPEPLDAAEKATIGKTVERVENRELRDALEALGQTLGQKAKASGR